jgi:hypothetical protein
MNPIVVIGAGGSGKWIATDVKLAAIAHRNRELLRVYGEAARERPDWDTPPPHVKILTIDVSRTEMHPVERQDGFRESFSLDYSEASTEYSHISSEYRKVIESIAAGNTQDFPRIATWLSKKDAACYNLRRLGSSAEGGAGQLRQLGRVSLFLGLQGKQELLDRIADAIRGVSAERRAGARVTIFVCGSLAGGTGSGTLWDVAALAQDSARGILAGNFDMVGVVVLPGTFSSIVREGTIEPARMAANTYAGLRELSRLMSIDDKTEFAYNENKCVTLDGPLFTIAYLVEGSRPGGYDLAKEEPRYGTYPAIADMIHLHSATTVDLRQVRSQMVQQPDGVFSTMGAVRWIFPAEEIILEGGHLLARLSLEALSWGRRIIDDTTTQDARNRALSKATHLRDTFFGSTESASSGLVRFAQSFLVQARKPQLLTSAMSQIMRFNDKDRDENLPTLNLSEVVEVAPRGSKGNPAEIKQQAENLVTGTLGGEGDALGAGRKTVHAVMNHYRSLHEETFRRFLTSTVNECLNDASSADHPSARLGGLLRAEMLLTTISETLGRFRHLFAEVYSEQCKVEGTNIRSIERANQEVAEATRKMSLDEGMLDRLNNRRKQAEYLRLTQRVFELLVQDIVQSTIVDIADRWIRTVTDLTTQVSIWLANLRDDVTALDAQLRHIQTRRREAARIESHRYLTEPGDDLESALIHEQLGVGEDQDFMGAASVRSTLSTMAWDWQDGELFLISPDPDSRGGQLIWRQHGLPSFVRRCFKTFEEIRGITIWDAFARTGYSSERLRSELVGRRAPITVVDLEEQQRFPGVELVPKDFVLAAWEEAQTDDSADSPRRLSQKLRQELGNEAVRWDDPHVLLAVSQRHLVKLKALGCSPRLRDSYERILTGRQSIECMERRLPLHLFPGESLAAELELTSTELLGEPVAIPPEFVALLEQEEDVVNFALAVAYGYISGEQNRRTAEFSWMAKDAKLEDGYVGDVHFGENILDACNTFIAPGTPTAREGRKSVLAALEASIEAFSTTEKYVLDLREKARHSLVPEQDTLTGSMRIGFDRALRMLIRRRAAELA